MPPHTRADGRRADAHLAVTRVLFQRHPECLFNLVAAYRAEVQGKLQLCFDGTLKGSTLHWEQVRVLTVPSMDDLPLGAFNVAPSETDDARTVLLEVLTDDEVFVYALPLETFFGVDNVHQLHDGSSSRTH